jgi:subtilisin family serine protease
MRFHDLSFSRTSPHHSFLRRLAWSILLMLLLLPLPAAAQELTPSLSTAALGAPQPDRLLVGLASGLSIGQASVELAAQGFAIERYYPDLSLIEAVSVQAAAAAPQGITAAQAAQAALSRSATFRYVELDYPVQIAQTGEVDIAAAPPNDPRAEEQWAIEVIGTLAAWDITVGNDQVAIAVLDTGYETNHADLAANRLWINSVEADGQSGIDDDDNGYVDDINGWDWVDNDDDARDFHGHGTHVLGIIAATTNNNEGIAGHASNLAVAPLRVLDDSGNGYISDVIAGLEYARSNGFRIANLSLTVTVDSEPLAEAVQAAADAGLMIVAAAGNSRGDVLWPAAYPVAVAVAATTSQDQRADFSNTGASLDLAAPGSDILSTYLDNRYSFISGTSMATPHVCALAGLILSIRPDLTAPQLLQIMQATADDINAATNPGPDSLLGAGRINMPAALLRASEELDIRVQGDNPVLALGGSPVAVPYEVHAPSATGDTIKGAVLTYQLVENEDELPVGIGGQVVTDGNGRANVSFNAPVEPGAYRLITQVGRVINELPVAVANHAVTVTLILTDTLVEAGSAPIDFRIELRGPDGELETVQLPVELSTTLGSFGGEVTTLAAPLVNGVYSGTLTPGTVAGTAHIEVRLGKSTDEADVVITPTAPAQIVAPAEGIPEVTAAGRFVPLAFIIRDRYGNAVADGIPVSFSSTDGKLTPNSGLTKSGQVTSTLQVAPGQTGTVRINIRMPSANLESTVVIQLIALYFMPFAYNQRN